MLILIKVFKYFIRDKVDQMVLNYKNYINFQYLSTPCLINQVILVNISFKITYKAIKI